MAISLSVCVCVCLPVSRALSSQSLSILGPSHPTFDGALGSAFHARFLWCRPDCEDFFLSCRIYFPTIYDIKYLMRSCKTLKGGLQDVADELGVSVPLSLPLSLGVDRDLHDLVRFVLCSHSRWARRHDGWASSTKREATVTSLARPSSRCATSSSKALSTTRNSTG